MPRNSINMARTTAGRRRKVMNFPYSLNTTTANNSRIDVGTDVYLWERTQPCSYAFWMNLTTIPTGVSGGHIFSEYLPSGAFRGRTIRIDTSLLRFWLINTFSANELKVSYSPPMPGRWVRIVFTYDGSSTAAGVKCYFNNVLQTQVSSIQTLTGTILSSGLSTRWFQWGGATALGISAFFANPAIMNYEMTALQVADDWYSRRFSGGTPVDVYELTEGSGTSVVSTGSGAHNGTLGAGVTWNSTNTPMKPRTAIPQARLSVS